MPRLYQWVEYSRWEVCANPACGAEFDYRDGGEIHDGLPYCDRCVSRLFCGTCEAIPCKCSQEDVA